VLYSRYFLYALAVNNAFLHCNRHCLFPKKVYVVKLLNKLCKLFFIDFPALVEALAYLYFNFAFLQGFANVLLVANRKNFPALYFVYLVEDALTTPSQKK
jgi:hypothetical protein